MQKMAEDIGHCGSIASSAIVLTTDRSLDIRVPVALTLMLLKGLCDKNIEMEIARPLPPQAEQLAGMINFDIREIQKLAYSSMQEIVDDYLEQAPFEKVNLKGL